MYGTCIGATTQFGEAAKGLIGISGIVLGIGEILGKFTFFFRPLIEGFIVTGYIHLAFVIRRRIVWIVVQEQSLQTDLCGIPGNGGPFRRFLFDLP